MRVYLAFTLPALAAALQAGQIGPPPLAGFAVTPALREWYASGDLEELEYAAMAVAARASLRTLAADVPDEQVTNCGDLDEPAAVRIGAAVPLTWVASAHVDDPSAAADVRAEEHTSELQSPCNLVCRL